MNIIQIIWILILIFAFLPVLKQQRINSARLKTLRLIQKKKIFTGHNPYTPAGIFKFSRHTPYSLY